VSEHTLHLNAAFQRLYRGVDALLAPFREVDDSPAAAILSPAAFRLYRQMSKTDRAHSLRLLSWLRRHGYEHPALLTAALLHDAGKAQARLKVWQRTLKVLLRHGWPGLWYWLARPASPRSWRHPFYILQAHPQIGAELARQAGCDELTCWLIRSHETDLAPDHPQLAYHNALQDADAAS